MTTAETDLQLSDGRILHVYDAPPDGADPHLVVFWHHGTPNTGMPPEPLFPAAAQHGIRWVSYDVGPGGVHPGRPRRRRGRLVLAGAVAAKALEGSPDGQVDDELAYVAPWGFDPGQVRVPALFLHGGQDRVAPVSHGRWLAARAPAAELWLRPDDGRILVLSSAPAALGWLRERT